MNELGNPCHVGCVRERRERQRSSRLSNGSPTRNFIDNIIALQQTSEYIIMAASFFNATCVAPSIAWGL